MKLVRKTVFSLVVPFAGVVQGRHATLLSPGGRVAWRPQTTAAKEINRAGKRKLFGVIVRENVRKFCLPVVSSKLVESHSTPSVDRTSPLCCHAWLPFPIWCSTKNLTKDLFCSAITTNLYLRGKRLLVLKTPSSISYLGIGKSSPNSASPSSVFA